MTIVDTLNATFHAIEALQFDVMRRLQSNAIAGQEAVAILRALDIVEHEFRQVRRAANHSPELYSRFAAAGGSAHPPSRN